MDIPQADKISKLVPSKKDRRGQFVISTNDLPSHPEARSLQLCGVNLAVFPDANLHDVTDTSGRPLGWLFGDVIDYQRSRMLSGSISIPINEATGVPTDEDIEKHVYCYGGRFVFVLALPSTKRIYLDADGALSVVYDASKNCVASTTGLLLDDDEYERRFDCELYNHLCVHEHGWFPAGLTAHLGVERLFCNHYLDLDEWRAVRHWPTEDLGITSDPLANVLRITEIAQSSIRAMRNSGSTAIALTAGNETRLLLASIKDMSAEVDFVTVATPSTKLDVERAQQLANEFGLRHRLLPLISSTNDQALSYRYGSGHCIGGGNVYSHPSIEPLSKYKYFSGGLGGEIGRAFFWRSTDNANTKLTVGSIISRFGMPMHEKTVAAVEKWLPSVSRFDPLLQIDLAYMELRMSCWAFSQAYANQVVREMHPLISRESFKLMLQLPPAWKRENKLCTEGIRALWPELLSFPINRYGDYRDLLVPLGRAVKNPHLIARKLRKLYGS